MPTPTPRQPQSAPLPPGSPRHARTATEPSSPAPDDSSAQSVLQQRLQGAFLTIIGLAGLIGGVLFSIEAPRFTPVPVVFLTFWLVMVIVGKILFAGLGKLRDTGVTAAPAPAQLRAAAAVAGIIVAVGMTGLAATTSIGAGVANAICPGDATCPPNPGGPTLTFDPPTQTAGGQQGQQPGQQTGGNTGIATSPASSGGDNGPGIQAQTPEFGTPGQQAPNIPGNEPPSQGGGQPQGQQPGRGNGQGQSPAVQTTAPGGPHHTDSQQPQSGQPSSPTVTVTKTQSQCAVPGAAGAPGSNGGGSSSPGGAGPDGGGRKDGAPSWAYLVAEATGVMPGRRRPGNAAAGTVPAQAGSPFTDSAADGSGSTQLLDDSGPDGATTTAEPETRNVGEVINPGNGGGNADDTTTSGNDSTSSDDTTAGNDAPTTPSTTKAEEPTATNDETPVASRPGELIEKADRLGQEYNLASFDQTMNALQNGGAQYYGPKLPASTPAAAPDTPEPWVDPSGSGTKLPPASQAPKPTIVPDNPPAPVTPEPWMDPNGSGTLLPPASQAAKPTTVPDTSRIPDATPGQPWVDPSGSGTKLPPAVDAAPGQWKKYGDDIAGYQQFFPPGVYPTSATTTNHNGVENIAYTMSDGSTLNLRTDNSGDAPLFRATVENSPIFGDSDLDSYAGTVSQTKTVGQKALDAADNINTATSFIPGIGYPTKIGAKGVDEILQHTVTPVDSSKMNVKAAEALRKASAAEHPEVPSFANLSEEHIQTPINRALDPERFRQELVDRGVPAHIADSVVTQNPFKGLSPQQVAERTLRWDSDKQRWGWDWPSNNGFLNGAYTTPDRIPEGLRLDRIGSSEAGGFMGKAGDTYAQRALNPGKIGDYIVVEGTGIPINTSKYEIRTGTVGPAMGQPGGGTQWVVYTTRNGKLEEVSLDELSRLGYIRIISMNGKVKP